MNDTQKRIEAYRQKLPGLKEKVAAVALLLVISFVISTTATFAWLVISKNPAVQGTPTSFAANGNLEIALASGNVNDAITVLPPDSAVGDGALDITDRNLKWGNIINLSDPIYGLDSLVLRPAQLNRSALSSSPLYGAVYTPDGRIEMLASNFGFARWEPPKGDVPGYFKVSNSLGVRAISSTMLAESSGYVFGFSEAKQDAEAANAAAGSAYLRITQNKDMMEALSVIMGTYMTARMTPDDADLSNPSVKNSDLVKLKNMFEEFKTVFDLETIALAELANFHLYIKNAGGAEYGGTPYTAFTEETILSYTGNLSTLGVRISNLAQFKTDKATLEECIAAMNIISSSGDILWQNTFEYEFNGVTKTTTIAGVINKLVDVGSCMVDGNKVNNIGASIALNLNNKTKVPAIITNGILQRFEQRNGNNMNVGSEHNSGKGLKVAAKAKRYGISADGTIYVYITTNATAPSLFASDIQYGLDNNKGGVGESVAQDTYGLAIDFWVRTNAQGSYLTLQGNVLTKSETVQDTGKDMDGEDALLYNFAYTETVENEETGESETLSFSYILYKKNDKWYDSTNHLEYKLPADKGEPTKRMVVVETVIGYEGENRVWDESASLSVNSTTQGSGSCYVYYADTPEDQARSLRLLAAMNVVFVDDKGNLLTTATMDTKRSYEDSGKVTVPLVLGEDSLFIGNDAFGNPKYAITNLEKNVAKRITAIVYLDGTKLSNSEVLASADIQGQLNIQFGSSVALNHFENEKLKDEEIVVSATVENTSFDYDAATSEMKSTVKVNVQGMTPKTVTAFFTRAINSYQGSREETMNFVYSEAEGMWKADYVFEYPGNYVLKSVRIDGIEYNLDPNNRPNVSVKGFAIETLVWDQAAEAVTFMTADSSKSANVSLKFATSDEKKLPSVVTGRFLREDGTAASVTFTYNPTNQIWSGKATFLSSGEYVLEYLVLDGNYVEIPSSMRKYITLYLGMRAKVYTSSPISFKYLPSEMTDNQKNLGMQVIILDDTGEEVHALKDLKLTYYKQGSLSNKLDCDLTWNAAEEYYEGTFHTYKDDGSGSGAGVFEFNSVSLPGSIITKATESPVFKIISPNPPELYDTGVNEAYMYVPGKTAMYNLRFTYSDGITIHAKIKDLDSGIIYDVEGIPDFDETIGEESVKTWLFTIPSRTVMGTEDQDGNWQLVEVNAWGCYDRSGNEILEEDPLVFNLEDKNLKTKVVKNISMQFTENKSVNIQNGVFMDQATISGLQFNITDFEGKGLDGISNLKLTFTHDNNSKSYGGYELGSDAVGKTITINFETANGSEFMQVGEAIFKYAGTYTPVLSFNFGGSEKSFSQATLPINTPSVTIKTVAPSVKITKISPTGTINADTAGRGEGHASVTVPAFTDTNAEVYFSCTTSSGLCGATYHNYARPSVTITLAGIGNAESAELIFYSGANQSTHVYNGTTSTGSYSWTANGACARNIGDYTSASASTDQKTPAGTIVAKELTMTYGGVTYTFDITDITINNPY